MNKFGLSRLSLLSTAAALCLSAASTLAFAQNTASAASALAPPVASSTAARDAAPVAPASPQPPETAEAQSPIAPGESITPPGSNSPRSWTTDQILTATVHQAWVLAGKDEQNFFEIVRELAEISAQNRNLKLPDTPEAGKKAGAFIRAQAKADHDQLLYEIVDKAVRMTGTRADATEAAERPVPHPGI